ncbi:MAG: aminomethyl-transferring glycine dehydrogenase [Candidatus Latescibacterota bacterium]|nr:aminomethyl-transferring glycine dehydrogenase [Candidatus Latescibacterota bacterium]
MPSHSNCSDRFALRHIGPRAEDVKEMLATLGLSSLDELMDKAVPQPIRSSRPLQIGEALTEHDVLLRLRELAASNCAATSYIGMGYHDCVTPPVIQRNILENPAWYTSYTPYQSEIAQGRLEALLNFQTMVIDLTGLEIANASLLDEATAAAEAMAMLHAAQGRKARSSKFFVASDCHPQTIEVVQTRARCRGWKVVVAEWRDFTVLEGELFGALLQYPGTDGAVDPGIVDFTASTRDAGVPVIMATDLLALTLLTPPGEIHADIAVGSSQRLGMPMGMGGPHAAFLAARESFKRQIPGRIIGVTRDAYGKPALRMALQTREQHIRREKATSNICTAEVLPAVVASMYAVYHGPKGLRRIAESIHIRASRLAAAICAHGGLSVARETFFDTLCLRGSANVVQAAFSRARAAGINLRRLAEDTLTVALDETTSDSDLTRLLQVLIQDDVLPTTEVSTLPPSLSRQGHYLQHPVFHSYRSETEMLRYMRRLDARDLSLTTSMIPLGSCTMKLNATVEMMPITWPEFAAPHPFAPVEQNPGYTKVFAELEEILVEITGMARVSLQPNAGSQGEYAGLLVIRQYQAERGEGHRRICLIPASAHGTNPASAVMAGLKVVVVACDTEGNIDVEDLRAKAERHSVELAALMVTYPSTHGVFEKAITDICRIVHEHGGQVYMDGANMNAMVGLCRPGEIGVDVCHLNLHKTFCIPHGGGGPGMGPIAVAEHLVGYLPHHSVLAPAGSDEEKTIGVISAAPYGSAVILLISWSYLKLMGAWDLEQATRIAILNANYVACRLDPCFPVLYRGREGFVAHEAICDLRGFKKAGIEVEDLAKRLMDYGYHAPTVHFPVPGTVMIEPTESESRQELDRFCDAMEAIREEIAEIERGEVAVEDSALRNAPHTQDIVLAAEWNRPYSREQAARPASWLREHKFWPRVSRIDNTFGDRQLVCFCQPVEAYAEPSPNTNVED